MINKITITGADDNVSHKELISLSKEYPFVEWGVLISESRFGTDRYPSFDWIGKLIVTKQFLNPTTNLSLHICGSFCKQILLGKKPDVVFLAPYIFDYFDRIQLNFNVQKSDVNINKLFVLLSNLEYNNIIFQYNKSNAEFMDFILKHSNDNDQFNYLYDSSGGNGIVNNNWKPPLSKYTGYAGGLSPDNIEENINSILELSGTTNVWLDMESGVRTNDKFDLDKVVKVLEISKKYINNE